MRRVYFRSASQLFATRIRIGEAGENARAVKPLAARVVLPLLLAAGFILICILVDPALTKWADRTGFGGLNEDSYDSLLESVAAVTGVFLALYFTAVSAVIATVYAAVPHDIRALMLRDRLGNIYVQTVSFTTALTLLALMIHAATDTAYLLAVPVIVALAVFSIFAFIRLGQRAFALADPTLLLETVISDFLGWVKRAQVGGWRWNVAAFQDHYRRRARQSLDSLVSLAQISAAQKHLQGDPATRLCVRTASLLSTYLRALQSIPTQSRWFARKIEHPQWYLVGSTALDMATATESPLQPTEIPDTAWVESELLGSITNVVLSAVRDGRLEDAYEASSVLSRTFESLGQTWRCTEGTGSALEFATDLIDELCRVAHDGRVHSAHFSGLIDAAALAPLSVEIGINVKLDSIRIPELGRRIRETDWSKVTSPYDFDFPIEVRKTLEEVHAGVRFERNSHAPKESRTPGWYVEEIALHSFAGAINKYLDEVVRPLIEWYPIATEKLLDSKRYDGAVTVLSRALETVWKLERHLPKWKEIIDGIESEGHRVDFKRPVWDWDSQLEAVERLKRSSLVGLSQTIPHLALEPQRAELPDNLGYAVHRTGEACFNALECEDNELFAELFPKYFAGALFTSERVRTQVTGLFAQQALTWLSEPILDCLELSGYAILFSELYENRAMRDACEAAWNGYLDEDSAHRLTRIAALCAYHGSQLGLTPRSSLRMRWQMAFTDRLSQLPREPQSAQVSPFDTPEVDHPSALIRNIAPMQDDFMPFLMNGAVDVFVVRFLRHLDAASGLDFGVSNETARDLEDEDASNE